MSSKRKKLWFYERHRATTKMESITKPSKLAAKIWSCKKCSINTAAVCNKEKNKVDFQSDEASKKGGLGRMRVQRKSYLHGLKECKPITNETNETIVKEKAQVFQAKEFHDSNGLFKKQKMRNFF